MKKLIIGTFSALFILCAGCVIYYWRDTGYDPSAKDLLIFFFILPAVLCAILLSPFLIYQGIQYRKLQKLEAEKQAQLKAEEQDLNNIENAKPKPLDIEKFSLHVFSAAALHSFGQNEQIVEEIQQFKSPELDQKLFNGYGLPVLSYRISDLDELTENQDNDDEFSLVPMREKRIQALIQQQLEEHGQSIFFIADHLKKSALFYDSEMAYQYRMHPGWVDQSYRSNDENESDISTQTQVSRLNRLNIHILLAENLIHQWRDEVINDLKQKIADEYSILPALIHIEAHFIGVSVAYSDWLNLLKQISEQTTEVSLIINVDSEIDQEWIDEKSWLQEQYIASEYVSSWCIASQTTQIENLEAIKVVQIVANETNLSNSLTKQNLNQLAQFEQEQPFLLMLDEATDIKVMKQTQQTFENTAIENHHFLYTKQNLGHTQNLAKIFGFMLGVHLPEELIAMIYSTDQKSTFAFIQDCESNERFEQEMI